MLTHGIPEFSDDLNLTQAALLVRDFYQTHRDPDEVFDINQLTEPQLKELAMTADVPMELIKTLLYIEDLETAADSIDFGHFQNLGHLKNDISPQALVDLGDTEVGLENGQISKLLADSLDNIELSIYYAYQLLHNRTGVQFDQIVLDNEQDQNHVVIEISANSFKYNVENMTAVYQVNLEQHLFNAISKVRFWHQVYSA